MTCDFCGKTDATVHLTEIINDQTRELHLCEPCAREKGVKVENPFGLADLLTGLADLDSRLEAAGAPPITACPQCGMRFEDFKRSGRLGCGACYDTFRRQLGVLLKQIHGATQHAGKAPAAASLPGRRAAALAARPPDVEQLKARLRQAVKDEAFEEAAQLRDQIRLAEQAAKPKGAGRAQRHRGS